MTPLPTLTAATDDGRVLELVEQIESAERFRDLYRNLADASLATPIQRNSFNEIAARHDNRADTARAELRAIIGVDAWRLANAIGA